MTNRILCEISETDTVVLEKGDEELRVGRYGSCLEKSQKSEAKVISILRMPAARLHMQVMVMVTGGRHQ